MHPFAEVTCRRLLYIKYYNKRLVLLSSLSIGVISSVYLLSLLIVAAEKMLGSYAHRSMGGRKMLAYMGAYDMIVLTVLFGYRYPKSKYYDNDKSRYYEPSLKLKLTS